MLKLMCVGGGYGNDRNSSRVELWTFWRMSRKILNETDFMIINKLLLFWNPVDREIPDEASSLQLIEEQGKRPKGGLPWLQ